MGPKSPLECSGHAEWAPSRALSANLCHSDNKAGPGTAAQSVGRGFAPERLKTLELRANLTNNGIELLFWSKTLEVVCRRRSTSAGAGRPSATSLSPTGEAARLAGEQTLLKSVSPNILDVIIRYKKCIAAGMKPGLVLSDEQCQKRFGPRKGVKDDRFAEPASRFRFTNNNPDDITEETVDDPDATLEREVGDASEYSVLIDCDKSYKEQNKIGRQLFISLFDTGSVSSEPMPPAELQKYDAIDDTVAMMASTQLERQLNNARKFVSFNQRNEMGERSLFQPGGLVNTPDVMATLIDQMVLVLRHNNDFTGLPIKDQAELLESNVMVAAIVASFELYSPQTRLVTWRLTENDFRMIRTLGIEASDGRVAFGLTDVLARVEVDIKDDMVKMFKFLDYFSHLGVPSSAMHLLSLVVIFTHDCCDLEAAARVEERRRHHLFLLFECLVHSEGVLGACNVAARLHGAINDLNRICQLLGQKFVTVRD